jgi:hypothetical protein
VSSNFVLGRKENNEKIILKNPVGERKVVKPLQGNPQSASYLFSPLFKKKLNNSLFSMSRFYKIKQYLNTTSFIQTPIMQPVSSNKYLKKSLSASDLKIEGIFDQIFQVLNLFVGGRLNIIVHFCCINKNIQFSESMQKKIFISLQKFRNTSFFKEGIELLCHVAYNRNSANLLARFIAFQLKKVKRHKFLLSFLKQTLSSLLNSNFSKIKGVKIIVKGRLNGVPRAKHKMIIIGDVPVQSISTKLDYSQATAHNANGSYGIKVWVVEK